MPVTDIALARKILQRFWRWQRALTLGARGIVVDEFGQVLLVRQTYTKGWLFPGGGVEKGETIEMALARELFEEAGIKLTAPPELFGLYSNEPYFPGDHVAVYTIRHWTQDRQPEPNREIAEVRFFPVQDLPPDVTDGTRRRLDEFFAGQPRQSMW